MSFFFNGSRLMMVNEYVVQQDKKMPLPQGQLDFFTQTNIPTYPENGAVEKE
jgi:hypothetical protein